MLTVAICTLQRQRQLRRTLEALKSQVPSRTNGPGCIDFDVVVIDNSSNGDLARDLAASSHSPLILHAVHEPDMGLSIARNRALRESKGDIIVWLDDDACPRAGWLDAIARPFAHPSVAVVGGPVVIQRPGGQRPTWLPAEMNSYYSEVDHGPISLQLDSSRYLVGTNLAMRKDLAIALGGFDSSYGHSGSRLGGNEETQLVERMRADGHEVWYSSDAVVDHMIDEERWTRRWLLRRVAAQGDADARAGRALPSHYGCGARVLVGEFHTQLAWLRQGRAPQQIVTLALAQRAFYFGAFRSGASKRVRRVERT